MKGRLIITLLIVAIIALLAVYYLLGTDYLKQQRDNEALASQIIVEQDILAQIPQPSTDLEMQLSEVEAELSAARNVFPESLNSTRIIDAILRIADYAGVKAIPLITQPWTTEAIEGKSYSILRLHITVTGTFEEVTDFLSRLENGEMSTLVMDYVTIDRVETSFGGEVSESDIPQMVDSVFEIAVYSQPPLVILPEIEIVEEGLEE